MLRHVIDSTNSYGHIYETSQAATAYTHQTSASGATRSVGQPTRRTVRPKRMGSVGDDYVCPWCGRRGNGGYAHDHIRYPICTEGNYSCLWNVFIHRKIQSLEEFRTQQLMAIFPASSCKWRDTLVHVAKFLAGPPIGIDRIEKTHKKWTRAGWRFTSSKRKTQFDEVRHFLAN